MAELADATDLKSVGGDTVWVQAPPALFLCQTLTVFGNRQGLSENQGISLFYTQKTAGFLYIKKWYNCSAKMGKLPNFDILRGYSPVKYQNSEIKPIA